MKNKQAYKLLVFCCPLFFVAIVFGISLAYAFCEFNTMNALLVLMALLIVTIPSIILMSINTAFYRVKTKKQCEKRLKTFTIVYSVSNFAMIAGHILMSVLFSRWGRFHPFGWLLLISSLLIVVVFTFYLLESIKKLKHFKEIHKNENEI